MKRKNNHIKNISLPSYLLHRMSLQHAWLLSNVLLHTCVFTYFQFWNTWKKSDLKEKHVCTKFCFNWENMLQKCLKRLSGFCRAEMVKNTSFWVVFQVQNSVTPAETIQNSRHPPTRQTKKNVDPLKALVLKKRRVTIHRVSSICKFHFGQFREIWMTISTCIVLPANSWSTCFVCAWISGSKQNNCHSTPYLVTRCSTKWILFFPRIPDSIISEEI